MKHHSITEVDVNASPMRGIPVTEDDQERDNRVTGTMSRVTIGLKETKTAGKIAARGGSEEEFGAEYMRLLYQIGCDLARDGYPWAKQPPDY